MNFKLISSIFFITTFLFVFQSFGDVFVSWNPVPANLGVTDYKIYFGGESRVYTNETDVNVNFTNLVIGGTNFVVGKTYYFAATSYNSILNMESDFSDEVICTYVSTNNPTSTNVTYIGVKFDYGVDLTSINSKQILVMSVTNDPGNFYNESLIITNKPFIGIRPVDTNQYVYFGTIIQYGTSLTTLNTSVFPLLTFTNPPQYYYRSSLIITNNPF